jgi:hypothetical protein
MMFAGILTGLNGFYEQVKDGETKWDEGISNMMESLGYKWDPWKREWVK